MENRASTGGQQSGGELYDTESSSGLRIAESS
jgi:hypothetical protein